MAGSPTAREIPSLPGARVLLVEARYHARINDLLVQGARRVLDTAGAETELLRVPGALEIPPAIRLAADSGRYDAYVALGCVIRGETFHFELVAVESCRGLMELGTGRGLAIGNGILTVNNVQQAVVRAAPGGEDKGGHAALAALTLLALARRLATTEVP